MPREVLPLHLREGLKNIDPDTSLNELIALYNATPTVELASQYHPKRGQFLILHRWLDEQLFADTISNSSWPDELRDALHELNSALWQLAQNQVPEFFKINRQTGERYEGIFFRQAILSAAARFNGETVMGNGVSVTNWWKRLVRKLEEDQESRSDLPKKELVIPKKLDRLIDNIADSDESKKQRHIKDKRTLMAFYAGFIDATPQEAAEHSALLKKFTEETLFQR